MKVQSVFSIKTFFFAVCTDSKLSSVLLDRISYFISAVLRLCICAFLFDWKFSLSCSLHPLLLVSWFASTVSNPSVLQSVLVLWARGVYMCISASPLQQTALCVLIPCTAHGQSILGSCGPEIKWLTIFFDSVHLQW